MHRQTPKSLSVRCGLTELDRRLALTLAFGANPETLASPRDLFCVDFHGCAIFLKPSVVLAV